MNLIEQFNKLDGQIQAIVGFFVVLHVVGIALAAGWAIRNNAKQAPFVKKMK